MSNDNHIRRALRQAALSAALLLTAVPTALADSGDLGPNPATADYAAYHITLERDIHPNPAMMEDGVPGCGAQCADDMRATLWNLNNVGAR